MRGCGHRRGTLNFHAGRIKKINYKLPHYLAISARISCIVGLMERRASGGKRIPLCPLPFETVVSVNALEFVCSHISISSFFKCKTVDPYIS